MPITIGWVIPLILTTLQTTIFHMNSNVKCWWENTDFDPVSVYIIQGSHPSLNNIQIFAQDPSLAPPWSILLFSLSWSRQSCRKSGATGSPFPMRCVDLYAPFLCWSRYWALISSFLFWSIQTRRTRIRHSWPIRRFSLRSCWPRLRALWVRWCCLCVCTNYSPPVSVLYCFMNTDVQNAVATAYSKFKTNL